MDSEIAGLYICLIIVFILSLTSVIITCKNQKKLEEVLLVHMLPVHHEHTITDPI